MNRICHHARHCIVISRDSSRIFSDPRGGARRAGEAGRADSVRGRPEEAGGREERFPLPARRGLHQAEESRAGTHRLQLQTEPQGNNRLA